MTAEEVDTMSQSLEQCTVERRLECVYYGYTVHTNKTEQLQFRQNWSPNYLYPSDVLLYFCGHHPECSKLGSKIALQLAKHNVDHNFAVVGVLEHLNETMAVLEDKLPKFFTGAQEYYNNLSKSSSKINKNTIKSSEISDDVRAVLKHRLSNEYELYAHIKQKLFKQYNSILS